MEKLDAKKISFTHILDPYLSQINKFELLNEKKPPKDDISSVYVWNYTFSLANSKKYNLRITELYKRNINKVNANFREYHNISVLYDILGPYVIPPIGFEYLEIGEKLRFEMLTDFSASQNTQQIQGKYTKGQATKFAYQLIHILNIMQSVGISHINLKPDSVFIQENGDIRLGNFASSISFIIDPKKLNEKLNKNTDRVTGFTGYYSASDFLMFKKNEQITSIIPEKYDVFTFGMTFYIWVLFENRTKLADNKRETPELHEKFVNECKKKMMQYKLNDFIDIFDKCLKLDQKERVKFKDIKKLFENIFELQNVGKKEDILSITETIKKIKDLMNNGKFEAAIYFCRKAIKNNIEAKNNLEIYFLLIKSYCELGRFSKSIKKCTEFEQILSKTDFYNELMELYKAKSYILLGELENADNILQKKFNESYEFVMINGLLFEEKHKFSEALICYEKVLKILDNLQITENHNYNIMNANNAILRVLLKKEELEKFEENLKKNSVRNDDVEIRILNGKLHEINCDFDKAIECYENAGNICRQYKGEDNIFMFEINYCLANIYAKYDMETALLYAKKAESCAEMIYKQTNVKFSKIYTLYAQIYMNHGNYAKSLNYLEDALKKISIYYKYESLPCYDLLEIYYYMAKSYIESNVHEKCNENLLKILEIIKKCPNYKSANFMIKFNTLLGQWHIFKGEINKGFSYLSEAESCFKKSFKNMQFDLSNIYLTYGKGYIKDNRLNDGLKFIMIAYDFYCGTALKLQNKYWFAKIKENIGNVYYKMKKYDLAIPHYLKTLDIYKEKNLVILNLMINIADSYKNIGNYQKAIEFYLKILLDNQGITILLELGECYKNLNKYKEAEEYYEKALGNYENNSDKIPYTSFLNIKIGLCEIYLYNKNYELSLLEFEKIVTDEKCDDLSKIKAFCGIALAYKEIKNYQKSIEFYKKAQDIINTKNINELEKSNLLEISLNIVKLYYLADDYQNSMKLAENLLNEIEFNENSSENIHFYIIQLFTILLEISKLLKNTENVMKYSFKLSEYQLKYENLVKYDIAVIGAAENNLRKFQDAEKKLLEYKEFIENQSGEKLEIKSVYAHLAYLYKNTENIMKQKEFENKLISIS